MSGAVFLNSASLSALELVKAGQAQAENNTRVAQQENALSPKEGEQVLLRMFPLRHYQGMQPFRKDYEFELAGKFVESMLDSNYFNIKSPLVSEHPPVEIVTTEDVHFTIFYADFGIAPDLPTLSESLLVRSITILYDSGPSKGFNMVLTARIGKNYGRSLDITSFKGEDSIAINYDLSKKGSNRLFVNDGNKKREYKFEFENHKSEFMRDFSVTLMEYAARIIKSGERLK